jgi:hypothetical protein
MSLDQLRETWLREAHSPPGRKPAEELAAVTERAAELDRAVRRRDRIETVVALALLPIFGWVAWATPHPVSAVGAATVALACVVIPVRLRMARRRRPDPGLPLEQSLRAELDRIRAQERLLGSVAWWYLAPLGAGSSKTKARPRSWKSRASSPASSCLRISSWVSNMTEDIIRRPAEAGLAGHRDLLRWLAGLEEVSTAGGGAPS